MKKRTKRVIWPAYFDASKTKKEGRKVPKSIAVANPNVSEVYEAARRLGLDPELEADAAHPALPWHRTGRVLIGADGPKTQILKKVSKEAAADRQHSKK